jgi:hypothetical protein
MGGDGGEVSEIPRFAELCKDNVELGLDPAAASHPYEVTFTGSVSGSEAEIAKRFARYNTIFLYSIKLNDVEFDLGYCVDASDATRRGNCTGYEFEVGFSGVEKYTPNTPLPLGLLLSKVSISVDTSDPANMSVSYSFTLRLDAEAAFGGTPGALPATVLRVQGTRCDGTAFEANVDLMSMLVDNGFANATFRNLRGDLTMMFDLVQATAPNYDGVTVSNEYIEEIDGYRVRAVDVVTKKNRIADAVYGNALEQAAFRGQLGDPQSLVSNADKVITSSVLQAYGTTDGMPSGYDGNTAALLITQAFGDTNAFSNDKDVMQFAVFEALETNRPDIYWRHSHSADKDLPTWSEWIRLRFEPFVGATASAAGAAGFVPAPAAGDQNKFLHGDGNWSLVTDVAIGGDLGDLASARGQIGAAKEMPNLDFNTLITPGNYRITGNPTNGPSLPLNISGASIGSLIVAGIPGQNGRIFQIMISGSAVTWRTIQDSTGTAWSAWQQLLSGNKVGDGIRVTNGIISVPEMQGATSAQAGVSGLVPPPLAADAGKVLGFDGTWSFPKDVAIRGNLGDLASTRGQIGDLRYVSANSSLNDYTKTGQYFIPQDNSIRDTPYIGCPGWLSVSTSGYFIKQEFVEFSAAKKKWMRATDDKNKPENWFAWTEILTTASLGDGIRVTNGIISVPEYEGATASKVGTSGLVPPAAAGQANYVLCGDGEWRDIATLVAAAQARLAESVKAEEGAS